MKKSISLLLVLMTALAFTQHVEANHQLTVFDNGAELSNTSPINLVYLDEAETQTQVIYPASALAEMTYEPINSMTFYITDDGITVNGGLVRVSLTETDQLGFNNSYFENLTTVATISLTAGVNELVIVFDEPYLYHGGNLVLDTYVLEATECAFNLFEGERPDYYASRTRNEVMKFIPKTTFDYGTSAEYAAKVVPDEVTFNTVRAERTDSLAVTLRNVGQNAFTPTFAVDAPFVVNIEGVELAADEELIIPITFAPTAAGTFNGTLNIDCGPAGLHQVVLHGTALEAAIDLTVADDTDYGSYVPLYGADIDIVGTEGQVIYPAEMLTDMVGRDILGLKFHIYKKVEMNGGVIQISLKEVEQDKFSRPELVTDLTVVGTVVPVYKSTEFECVFDQPFHYEGGNLVVDCTVIEAGITNYSQTFFFGTPTDGVPVGLAKTYYYSGFDYDLVGFLPQATFSYQKGSVLRGDVNNDGYITIADVTALITMVLSGGEGAPAQADCNDDHIISVADVTALITFVLSGTW